MNTIPFFKITHEEVVYYLCKLRGTTLANITYVARRRESDEQGAVQRILNKTRISNIKDFLLNGGFFPNNIILNFSQLDNVSVDENSIHFSEESRIAQIIDGQHRVEGLKEAIRINSEIGDIEFPVLLTVNLSTEKCAELFVSINNEQKPVPKSLIYDLYGLLNVANRDFSIERGGDIAEKMNTDEDSPYQGYIKYSGSKRFKGGIQLSTFVNNLKPLIRKEDGDFYKYNIETLELQVKILINYFSAIEYYYDKEWDNTTNNPFLYASGFGAALDVFVYRILPHSFLNKNFSQEFFKSLFNFSRINLIRQTDVKGLSGEAARDAIKEKLGEIIVFERLQKDEFVI